MAKVGRGVCTSSRSCHPCNFVLINLSTSLSLCLKVMDVVTIKTKATLLPAHCSKQEATSDRKLLFCRRCLKLKSNSILVYLHFWSSRKCEKYRINACSCQARPTNALTHITSGGRDTSHFIYCSYIEKPFMFYHQTVTSGEYTWSVFFKMI